MGNQESEALRRNHWLGTIKDITGATQKRLALQSDLGMDEWLGDKEKAEKEKVAQALTESIAKSLQEQRAIEATDGQPFGLTALLDREPSQPIRHLLTLMIARALGQGASNQYMTVENYSEEISAGNYVIALEVRSAFRTDSDIRAYITFKPGETLEQSSNPRLREKSLNVVLGLARDFQSEVIGEWFRGGHR